MAPPAAIDIEGVTDTEAIVIPDPLTVNGVSARRAKAGKLIAGTAAYTSSDFFKHQASQPSVVVLTLLTLLRHQVGSQRPKDGTVSELTPPLLVYTAFLKITSVLRAKRESLPA